MKTVPLLALLLILSACTSSPKNQAGVSNERIFLENSIGSKERPDWTKESSVSKESSDNLVFLGTHVGLGSDRVSTCYRLAEADIQVRIAKEISQSVKSELLQMAEGTTDQLQPAVLDSILIESKASLQGVRVSDRYFERSAIGGIERIECFAQASISKVDYARAKQGLVTQLADKRPEVQAILDKRMQSFAAPAQNNDED